MVWIFSLHQNMSGNQPSLNKSELDDTVYNVKVGELYCIVFLYSYYIWSVLNVCLIHAMSIRGWISLVVKCWKILPCTLSVVYSTCQGSTKPMHHTRAWALEPATYRSYTKPLAGVCSATRNHHDKPELHNLRITPTCQLESLHSSEEPTQSKINKIKLEKKTLVH